MSIPWYLSCSFLVLIPFIVQAMHLNPCHLPPLSSAIHYCLCWYFYEQHQSSQTQKRLTSKEQCLKRNFDRLGVLPTVMQEISCRARKETQNCHLTSWCHVENKEPQTNTRNTGFTNATTWKTPCPDGALWSMDSACLLLFWLWLGYFW